MTVSPVTLLECNGVGCFRRLVVRWRLGEDEVPAGWSVAANPAPGQGPDGLLHYCPECTADPERRAGKRPQYQGRR
jgi:hypothetical protein